ncbi:hypothetical protein GCM10008939_24820 [Deinococcus aquiradiocola]|uniref:Uncharacterized protein n=2 Tax=Deinococcus aquiradiocola TaxID=393059 RepID=A0A917URR8_9DEIO|nr:hypothetical protein GCM10008939_24820 [Deinococcus aquiradiocola]
MHGAQVGVQGAGGGGGTALLRHELPEGAPHARVQQQAHGLRVDDVLDTTHILILLCEQAGPHRGGMTSPEQRHEVATLRLQALQHEAGMARQLQAARPAVRFSLRVPFLRLTLHFAVQVTPSA